LAQESLSSILSTRCWSFWRLRPPLMACAESPPCSDRLASEKLANVQDRSHEEALPRGPSPSRSTSASGLGSPECFCSSASSDSEDGNSAEVWRTDSQISSAFKIRERELQQWQSPSEGDSGHTDLFEETLEDQASTLAMDRHTGGRWNQFEANEAMFGVKSTFKDDLSQYTTPLDISKVSLAIRQKADRVAKEIETGMTGAHHHDGVGSDGDDDEEGLWSSVPRQESTGEASAKSKKTRKQSGIDKKASLGDSISTSSSISSIGVESCAEEPKVRGTFVHIDGVGIVSEQDARSMQGGYGRNAPMPVTAQTQQEMFAPGNQVVIVGLLKCPAFNGCCGFVQSFDPETSRYNIQLQKFGSQGQQLAKVKAENLRWVTRPPPPAYQ